MTYDDFCRERDKLCNDTERFDQTYAEMRRLWDRAEGDLGLTKIETYDDFYKVESHMVRLWKGWSPYKPQIQTDEEMAKSEDLTGGIIGTAILAVILLLVVSKCSSDPDAPNRSTIPHHLYLYNPGETKPKLYYGEFPSYVACLEKLNAKSAERHTGDYKCVSRKHPRTGGHKANQATAKVWEYRIYDRRGKVTYSRKNLDYLSCVWVLNTVTKNLRDVVSRTGETIECVPQ